MVDHRPAGVAVAADHVEHAGRQELGGDLGEQRRARRRRVARLEHDGVAGGDRRGELPDRHHHRVVPRGDLGADADRLAADERRVPGHVLAGALALEVAGRGGEEADLVDHRRDLLRAGQGDRLAGVLDLEGDQLLGRAPRRRRRCGTAPASAPTASCRATPRTPSAAACIAASTSAGRRQRRRGVRLARRRVDDRRWSARRAASTRLPLTKFENAFMASDHGTAVRIGVPPASPERLRITRHDRSRSRPSGVPREVKTAEHRVAMTPDGVRELERHGIQVHVEAGAGEGASISRRRLRRRRRRHRADRRRRLVAADGRQGQGAEGGGVRLPARRPHAVHLPPPRRLPGGRQGAARRRHDGARLRDGAARRPARCRCWRR